MSRESIYVYVGARRGTGEVAGDDQVTFGEPANTRHVRKDSMSKSRWSMEQTIRWWKKNSCARHSRKIVKT